jgi:tetratricopeptide (TPR) repeat protein
MRAVRIAGVSAILLAGSSAVLWGQIDPRTALLEKAGWDALVAGQAQAAAAAFREALGGDPKNPRLHFGAATAAYIERRNEDARDALERALTLDPKLARARALLGQVLHRMGDVPGAIRAYEALIAERPDDKEAVATLERWRDELRLHDRMRLTVGAHFTVAFEGPAEEAIAAGALESLERAYWRIGDLLGTYPVASIPVVLYTNEQFRDITRAPAWAAGSYDGTIRIPMRGALQVPQELDRVLAHEFTHALVRGLAARGVPTWLNEGLAAALEADDLEWARRPVRDAAGPQRLRNLLQGFGQLSTTDARLAYATSALVVRRLLEEAGGFAIANLLRDLGDGVDLDTAFLHRIQRPFADFQEADTRGF